MIVCSNPVGFIQEYCSKNKLDLPIYMEVESTTSDRFACKCTCGPASCVGKRVLLSVPLLTNIIAYYRFNERTGTGRNKKEAKQAAARSTFQELAKQPDLVRQKVIKSIEEILRQYEKQCHDELDNSSSLSELPNLLAGDCLSSKLKNSAAVEETCMPSVSSISDLVVSIHGVEPLNDLIDERTANKLVQVITKGIQKYASDIPCSVDEYIRSVYCWQPPSFLCVVLNQWVTSFLHAKVKQIFGCDLKVQRILLINAVTMSIPCHQDIVYNQNDPFEYSTLIPLQINETSNNSSDSEVLFEFLPFSHNKNTSPPVDFHDPNFCDVKRNTREWKSNAFPIAMKRHQAILFDSRIWYRFESGQTAPNTNFILKVNWKLTDSTIKSDPWNDMWSNKYIITSILQQGLNYCFQDFKPHNFKACMLGWMTHLVEGSKEDILIEINCDKVLLLLQKLWILDYAEEHHGGYDVEGKIKRLLWTELLNPLQDRLEVSLANDQNVADMGKIKLHNFL